MKKSSPNFDFINVSNSFLKHLKLTLLAFFSLLSLSSHSQTDSCNLTATAGQINVGMSCNYTTFNSSGTSVNYWSNPSGSGADNVDDAWGWFTATSTNTTINYKPANSRDAVLHLFTGSCSTNMTALSCSNIGANGVIETITYQTIINQKYFIRIQRNGNNGNMSGEICIYNICPTSAGTLSGNQYICRYTNTSTTFSSTVYGGIWSSNNTAVANVNSSTGFIQAGNSGIATITYTIGGGACPVYTNSRVVYVANGPGAGPLTLSGSQNQCTNTTATYTITPEPYSSSYTWSFSGTGVTITPASDGLSATLTYGSTATSGNLVVQSTNGCGNGGGGKSIYITVTPLPASTPVMTQVTYNNCNAVNLFWNQVTNATGYYLDISTNSSFSSFVSGYQNLQIGYYPSSGFYAGGLNNGTTYYFRIRAYNSCQTTLNSNTLSFIVGNNSNTSISYSGSPYCKSETGTKSVTRSGTSGGSYASSSGLVINSTTGAITPSTSISGTYTVTYYYSSSCGTQTAATLVTIIDLPTITSNPTNSIVAAGANTSFTVVASNNPTSYVWQVSTNGGGAWSTITNGGVYSNATTASLNITNATAGMNGYLYRASATNVCGTSSFSSSALLTVTLVYCFPTVDNGYERFNYIDEVTFLGNLINPPTNTSTWSISPRGYQDFTGLTKATQAQGEGVNIFVNTATGYGSNYMKAWVDWNNNGNFETTELVYQCTNAFANTTFGFQIPAATIPGDYRIRIRIVGSDTSNNNFNACTSYNNVDGETEDYLFTVVANCAAKITSITNGFTCGVGAVTLNAIGSTGTTEYRWYTTQSGGTFTSSPTSSWNTPTISVTSTYYVTAWNGSCESLFRTAVIATVKKVPSLTFSNSNPEICGEENIIDLSATGSNEQIFLVDENFEGNTITFLNNQIASPNPTITNWQVKSSTYVPLYPTYPVWYPAISSGFGTNKFIMSTSDLTAGGGTPGKVNEALELITAINTTDFVNLTMTFRIYFSSYYDNNNSNTEGVFIETNTGSGWTTLNSFLQDEGIGTNFVTKTISLNAFTNVNALKIRIRYRAGWCDGVAIDDIKIFGDRPLVPSFTWTSPFPIAAFTDLACTIPYAVGAPASTVYVKPTLTQLENATFSFTANANLANGCTTSGTINVTNKTRVWKGSVDTNWNNINNWSPAGIPTLENCVVVPQTTNISGTNFNAFGKNLRVKNVGNLIIQSSNNLIINDAIIVEPTGVFQIENNSNLVQINDVINTGNIIYKRTAPNIKGSDYVYWSSPVNNQALNSIYTSPAQGPKYSWNTLANNGNGTGGNISQGNYVNANGVTMGTGVGYILRGSSSFGMGATNINSAFTGRPNNGTINVPVSRGVYQGPQYTGANGAPITNLDDNYNLIGNPYPSAINALKFISDNSSVIRGNVQLWKHGSDPAANNGTTYTNPFYGTYAYNYSASDYITINNSGPSTPGFSENIKAGQAFFVEMLDGPTTSQTVNFNNSQRRDGSGIPYINDAFYKNANQQNANYENLERHRIWLDIKDVNNISEVALVGYIEGATMGDDSSYDAFATTLNMGIYSFINNQSYIIQGRSLPFDDNDQVSIGFNVPSAGNYSIGINTADGLFLGTQDIYLKDELLNIYHDLKTNPYSFTATAGIHNDRFKLVYKNSVLSTETFNQNEIQIIKNNTVVEIVSGNEVMDNVKIYDVRGRLLVEKTKINNNFITIDLNATQDQVLIINIVTLDGIKIIRKIL